VNIRERIVVFEGLEAAIRRIPDVAHWKRMFRIWHEWEQQGAGRTVVWIGSDITQGIVPVEKEERLWRDVTGWCYQQLAQLCDRVDRVWCGLAERMK
jgi:adenosylcobinamide kinase/adenosylcobinamide-phosphate guanylyltransferase